MIFRNKKFLVITILFFFGLIYSSISLYNHYNFRTFAFDLGLVNNAIYDYAHFRWNDCMLIQPQFENFLSDHFTLIQVILSPLSYLFGSYTMLIVQIVSILLGAYGIYLLFADDQSLVFALIAMVHFLTCWGVFSALNFDYHDNVVGTMAVPWLFYFFKKRKWILSTVMVIIILICKENMALWMIFLGTGLFINSFRDKKKMLISFGYVIASLFYFYAVISIIMPAFSNSSRGYLHFTYEVLGKNFGEAISFVFRHPIKMIQYLFENHLKDANYDGIKAELHFMVMVSGGYCFLIRPQFLVMLIPIYAQKLYSDDFLKWGINTHYSIEFVPILTIMVFTVLSTISNQKIKITLASAACALSFFFSMYKLDHRVSKWYDGERSRFYLKEHYRNNFDVALAHRVINRLIPEDAIVSAQHQVVPHLALRNNIYRYPDILDAQYIVLLEDQIAYPLRDNEEFMKLENQYINSPQWSVLYHYNKLLVLKKNH